MEAHGNDHRREAAEPGQGRPDATQQRGPLPGARDADIEEARPAWRLRHQVQGQLPVKSDGAAEAEDKGDSVSWRSIEDGQLWRKACEW